MSTVADIIVWAGATLPILFIVLYSFTNRWWTNAAGRSIVALDSCLALIFGSFVAQTIAGDSVHLTHYTTALLAVVPVVVLYRIVALARKHRAKKDPAPVPD